MASERLRRNSELFAQLYSEDSWADVVDDDEENDTFARQKSPEQQVSVQVETSHPIITRHSPISTPPTSSSKIQQRLSRREIQHSNSPDKVVESDAATRQRRNKHNTTKAKSKSQHKHRQHSPIRSNGNGFCVGSFDVNSIVIKYDENEIQEIVRYLLDTTVQVCPKQPAQKLTRDVVESFCRDSQLKIHWIRSARTSEIFVKFYNSSSASRFVSIAGLEGRWLCSQAKDDANSVISKELEYLKSHLTHHKSKQSTIQIIRYPEDFRNPWKSQKLQFTHAKLGRNNRKPVKQLEVIGFDGKLEDVQYCAKTILEAIGLAKEDLDKIIFTWRFSLRKVLEMSSQVIAGPNHDCEFQLEFVHFCRIVDFGSHAIGVLGLHPGVAKQILENRNDISTNCNVTIYSHGQLDDKTRLCIEHVRNNEITFDQLWKVSQLNGLVHLCQSRNIQRDWEQLLEVWLNNVSFGYQGRSINFAYLHLLDYWDFQ